MLSDMQERGTTLHSGTGKTMLVAVKAAIGGDRRSETITADSIFMWPNGYITVYGDGKDSESWAIYPPHRILSIRTEAKATR